MQIGETALIRAAIKGHLDIADLLIRHGAPVQHQDMVMWGEGGEGEPVWVRSFVWWVVCHGFGFELMCRDTKSDGGKRVGLWFRCETVTLGLGLELRLVYWGSG